jgi:carbamoyl-phosphate synthase large subunit
VSHGPTNVLLSSAGRRVALLEEFEIALGELSPGARVLATDVTPLASAFQRAEVRRLVPPCRDDAFIPAMLQLCEEHEIALVVPTIDTELPVLAAHRADFAGIGTTVAVSGPETVRLSADKVLTNQWLSANDLPTVRQSTPAEVIADPSSWAFPVVAKPRRGSSSIGLRIVDAPADLSDLLADPDYVVEERALGDEFTIDVLVGRSGEVRDVVVRRRIEIRGGEVSKGVTVRDPQVIALARELCQALPDAYGVLTVQLFVDPERRDMRVIEINPRFGGGFPLSWQAGARFPRWLLEEVLDLPSTCSPGAWRDGLVMLRYDDAVFVDAPDVGW